MKEVSCRFFDTPLRDLRERGVDPRALVEGTSYSIEHLAKKDERVEWSALLRMMDNARRLWSREQLLRLGEKSTEGPLVQFIGVVARLRFSVAGFYQWVTGPTGVASQMITCVKTTSRSDGPGRVIVDFAMEPGYAPSEEFFLITEGTYRAMPRMLGAPAARLQPERRPDGVRFHIHYAEPNGVIAGIRKAVTWPFTLRQAADELADAHASLIDRYQELESARAEVEEQRELLDVAYQLGHRIWSERDLTRVGDIVVRSLQERRGVTGVRLRLDRPLLVAEQGRASGAASASIELPASSLTGRLEAWTTHDSDATKLLELVAPTVALAVENAVAYQELAEYQTGLEKLVDERTSELRVARDQLAATVEQLRDAQDAREKFFGNISHEIRTPLSLILLATGDVERRAGQLLDERSRGALVAVTESARKLVRLVDELLLLAAGQADKLVLSIETTDLTALFGQVSAAWRPAAEANELDLQVRVPGALLANVDPVALERVVSNLLSNAVKYTPRGGRIDFEAAVEADHVRISVADTGPGIDADLAKRLFGRFERASGEDRRTSGTGIGLALVKQLVEAHHGTVAALGRDGGGTEIRVLLPRDVLTTEKPDAPPTFLRTTHAPVAMAAIRSGTVFSPAGLSNGTILIAEDEPRLAESVAQLLSDQYTVVLALDGSTALELVEQHQPQLLITDVDMPGMNGIELARRFREITGDRLAPIIILSAMLDLRTRVAGLEAGAIDYVGKPFDPAELRARVQAQFRMRDLAMRLHRAEQLSALGILTAGLAHELRNPANGIVNAIPPLIELLPEELVRPDTGPGQLLEIVKGCADHIAFLTRQLLGFRNNARLELRPTPLADLVARAVKLSHRALVGVEIRTDIAVPRNIPCAAPLLVQVLTNLVENAGHAAGPGGWISVTATTAGGTVTVEVADSGPGVPVELRERVFEPFFTTKAPGVGTGLGLTLARNIVHRHGGVLEIRQRGANSVFVIELNAESDLAPSVNAV